MRKLSLTFLILSLIAHFFLGIWGGFGLIEYLSGKTIASLQNPNFPKGTQFIHWVLASSAGFTFVLGYLKKWFLTPFIMVVLYACLATMCFIETFDFMTRESRYTDYFLEVLYYVSISLYLFKSDLLQKRFMKITCVN